MRKTYLILLAIFGFLFLMGCTVPEYVPCCLYTPAEGGQCILNNGTEYETDFCDMQNMTCNVTITKTEILTGGIMGDVPITTESKMSVPICPQRESGKCNVSCAGIFCGRFEFDPRPLFSTSDAVQVDEEDNPAPRAESMTAGSGGNDAIGLFNAECRMEEMSPAFINTMTNGQGITLNIFRFGIGNSFQEFDQASLYYPLTDKACQLNMRGSVDRYENYALPNALSADLRTKICAKMSSLPDSKWMCIPDPEIITYSYYDCATRCLLTYSGDSPAVDPGNPYLTERNGQSLGNPFAYGINWRHLHGSPMEWAYSYPSSGRDAYQMSMLMGRDVKGSALPESAFEDEYSFGYDYYGAEFGRSDAYISKQSGGWERLVVARGVGAFGSDVLNDYYYGADTVTPDLRWGGDAVEEFLTVNRDPHGIYAYLLPLHSVYAGQIMDGHYTMGGEWKAGAEFECTIQGGECISGFCNIGDYHRGTCVNMNNLSDEANCDCREEAGEVICDGMQVYSTKPWDRYNDPTVTINATRALSAPVTTGIGFFSITQTGMPSKGKVVKYEITGDEEEDSVLVIQLGGKTAIPDYTETTYDSGDEEAYRNGTLTIPQVLSPELWPACRFQEGCGKFLTTFVQECMPEFSDDYYAYASMHVCYKNNWMAGEYGEFLGPDGTILTDSGSGIGAGNNCRKLIEADGANNLEAFCYSRNNDGSCKSYSTSALVFIGRKVNYTAEDGETEIEGVAFGNCIFDESGDRLLTKTHGYCDQCSFLTMAKETIVSLPEDTTDPGYEKGVGERMDNKYCPTMEISTIFPPWETGSLGSSLNPDYGTWTAGGVHPAEGEDIDTFRYSECSMPDMTEAGRHEAWPDYLPEAYYLKNKIESYLKRNVQPVIFADDEGLYRAWAPENHRDSFPFVLDAYLKEVDGADTLDPGKTTHPLLMELWNKNPFLLYEFGYSGMAGAENRISSGTYLANSVYNQGPAIVVIRKFNMSDMETVQYIFGEPYRYIDAIYDQREPAIRMLCPNCMVSVAVGYDEGPEGGSGGPARMRQLSYLFDYRNATTGEPRWDYDYYGDNASCLTGEASCDMDLIGKTDMIAVKWELDTHNSHCFDYDLTEEQKFAAIVADEAEFGSRVMKRFGKPIVVTDFTIMRNRVGSCWTDETAQRFMVYLGMHADQLVKSGHTGLIYSDWTEWGNTDPKSTYIRREQDGVLSYRGEFFEGTFTAASLFAGKKEQTAYSMVYVTENCTCAPCTYIDDPNMCNGRFKGTGDLCEGYVEGSFAKWPDKCVSSGVCISPSELPAYKVMCNSYYTNGTEVQENFSGSEIAANPQLYPDVIASIKLGGKIPCAETQGKNISYLQLKAGGFRPFPLLFRSDGDMNYTCGEPSFDSFSACGVSIPVTNRRLDCVIAPNDFTVMLPPIGVDITSSISPPSGVAGGITTVPVVPRGIGG